MSPFCFATEFIRSRNHWFWDILPFCLRQLVTSNAVSVPFKFCSFVLIFRRSVLFVSVNQKSVAMAVQNTQLWREVTVKQNQNTC